MGDLMINVVIVTDGPYGDRAYEHIKNEFETEFIKLEQPTSSFADEIVIPRDTLKKLENADLLITYVLHHDLTLELVEKLHDTVGWIIVAAWQGKCFRNQVERIENVTAPDNMCDLSENGNPIFDEFTGIHYHDTIHLPDGKYIPGMIA